MIIFKYCLTSHFFILWHLQWLFEYPSDANVSSYRYLQKYKKIIDNERFRLEKKKKKNSFLLRKNVCRQVF